MAMSKADDLNTEGLKIDSARKALDPKYGEVLLGAYLQDVANRLDKSEDPILAYYKAHKAQIVQIMSVRPVLPVVAESSAICFD